MLNKILMIIKIELKKYIKNKKFKSLNSRFHRIVYQIVARVRIKLRFKGSQKNNYNKSLMNYSLLFMKNWSRRRIKKLKVFLINKLKKLIKKLNMLKIPY